MSFFLKKSKNDKGKIKILKEKKKVLESVSVTFSCRLQNKMQSFQFWVQKQEMCGVITWAPVHGIVGIKDVLGWRGCMESWGCER